MSEFTERRALGLPCGGATELTPSQKSVRVRVCLAHRLSNRVRVKVRVKVRVRHDRTLKPKHNLTLFLLRTASSTTSDKERSIRSHSV